jgi:hypothetical protein
MASFIPASILLVSGAEKENALHLCLSDIILWMCTSPAAMETIEKESMDRAQVYSSLSSKLPWDHRVDSLE